MEMEMEQKLILFRDMITCCHNLYLWQFDSSLYPIDSNCPNQAVIENLFFMIRQKEDFVKLLKGSRKPVLFSDEIGMMWAFQSRFEGDVMIRLFALGPFSIDNISPYNIEQGLKKYELSLSLRRDMQRVLSELPVISVRRVMEYGIMLHFCIYGEKITVSDFWHQESSASEAGTMPQDVQDSYGTYEAECEMLRLVREGDIQNYRVHMNKMATTGSGGKLSTGDPLRQIQNSILSSIVLHCRAAIEGGLAPEISYILAEHYFQSVEASHSLQELSEINHNMQEDYVLRVHRIKTEKITRPIQTCMAYIEQHLEERLTLEMLALKSGYSEYHFCRRFKAETGFSPGEFMKKKRLERAALLLRTTRESVQAVSTRLQFCSQSYFSNSFRKEYGMTPTEYRSSFLQST